MFSRIFIFLILFAPMLAIAGMFDDLVNKTKKSAEEVVDKTIDSVTSDEESSQGQQVSGQPIASSTGHEYITIQDIPADRRPATFGTLGLARLLYDTSWLDENLLKATQLSIDCQQFFIKHGAVRGSGCMGEFLGTAKTELGPL